MTLENVAAALLAVAAVINAVAMLVGAWKRKP
jgi:hypothetical protein